jgi:hypothetical protein
LSRHRPATGGIPAHRWRAALQPVVQFQR